MVQVMEETLGRISGQGSYADNLYVEGARIDMVAEGAFLSGGVLHHIYLYQQVLLAV